MYLLVTDETNVQAKKDIKFFLYGGLTFDVNVLGDLHDGIAAIREKYGYKAGDNLKFNTRSRPDQVSASDATKAKEEVVDLCINLECRFLAYMVLHEIAKNQDRANIIKFGVNSILGRFERFLSDKNSTGIALVDNFPIKDPWKFMADCWSKGLQLQDEQSYNFERVKLLGATCSNASHVSSAVDIVLGAFRYCANEPKNKNAAAKMISDVTKLIWRKIENGKSNVLDYGLIQSPKIIKVDEYRQEYGAFIDHVNELLTYER